MKVKKEFQKIEFSSKTGEHETISCQDKINEFANHLKSDGDDSDESPETDDLYGSSQSIHRINI